MADGLEVEEIEAMCRASWLVNCERNRVAGLFVIPWDAETEDTKAYWRESMVAARHAQHSFAASQARFCRAVNS